MGLILHFGPPHDIRRYMPMQSVLLLKVTPPSVAGGSVAPIRSLERLLMGANELLDADAQYVPP